MKIRNISFAIWLIGMGCQPSDKTSAPSVDYGTNQNTPSSSSLGLTNAVSTNSVHLTNVVIPAAPEAQSKP